MKFCVIGLGRFGYHVATTLAENGMEVLGVESNESIVASIRDLITHAICMQVQDESSLRTIGIEEMDTVIVAMGENFAQSILITAILKKRLRIPLVITRAVNEIHKDILLLIGADEIVLPEQEIGAKLADRLSLPFPVLARVTKDFSISEIHAPQHFIGESIEQLNLYEKYGIHCVAIKQNNEITTVGNDYIINEGDQLIISGANERLKIISKL